MQQTQGQDAKTLDVKRRIPDQIVAFGPQTLAKALVKCNRANGCAAPRVPSAQGTGNLRKSPQQPLVPSHQWTSTRLMAEPRIRNHKQGKHCLAPTAGRLANPPRIRQHGASPRLHTENLGACRKDSVPRRMWPANTYRHSLHQAAAPPSAGRAATVPRPPRPGKYRYARIWVSTTIMALTATRLRLASARLGSWSAGALESIDLRRRVYTANGDAQRTSALETLGWCRGWATQHGLWADHGLAVHAAPVGSCCRLEALADVVRNFLRTSAQDIACTVCHRNGSIVDSDNVSCAWLPSMAVCVELR